jgi:hypothetical protein
MKPNQTVIAARRRQIGNPVRVAMSPVAAHTATRGDLLRLEF